MRRIKIMTMAIASIALFTQAHAQTNFPSKPVRLINPAPAGTGPDLLARLYAQKLGEMWSQQVLVENRTGASGIIAAEAVAKAPADGYTLLWTFNAVMSINPVVFAKLPYDPLKDFATVTQVNRGSYVLVAAPDVPARNVTELIAMARSKPGAFNYASYGAGGGSHLAAELFKSMAKVNLVHVPFKTGAMNEVMAGRVAVLFEPAAGAISHVKAGKVKALGFAGGQRYSALPDTPTIAESLPGFEVDTWQGVFAPAATSREIVARIARDMVRVQELPDIKQRLGELGFTPVGNTPEAFATVLRAEMTRWATLAREIQLKQE
jgi:tripartite-type tricarboxylate transporter receptor subunit TctC